MSKQYTRGSLTLARMVFNTPQMIVPDDLQAIAQYLVNRAHGDVEIIPKAQVTEVKEDLSLLTEQEQKELKYKQLGITNDGKRGNLEIQGTLVAKGGQIDADCMELTSYEKLYSTFQKQVNEGIQEVVLHVNSGGGEARTCFEMAREFKALATEKNIKIYAFVDGMAASAAYAWASIADEIIARKDSQLGSVGVVVQLINNNKMLENIGLTRTFVYNGEQKIPFNAEGEFSPQFLAALQKKVDKSGLEFNTFVAQNRNMKVEDVIATQAEVFDAEEALKVGFLDKVMTRSEFFNDYLPKASSQSIFQLQHEDTMSKQDMTVEQLQASLSEVTTAKDQLTADLATTQASLADLTAQLEALQGEKATLLAEKEALAKEKLEAEEAAAQAELKAKLDKREATLKAIFGSESEMVASLLATTKEMSDEAFDVVAQGFGVKKEAAAAELEEQGDDGEPSEQQLSLAELIASQVKA